MRIGVLGTGVVGQTLGRKLVELGHEVRMGSRSAGGERALEWARGAGEAASEGTFADAAEFGELLVSATAGSASVEALRAAGEANLAGKAVIDTSNPLDFSGGMPPTLAVCNDDSVGEQLQREFPGAHVVKALNTITAAVMVDPGLLPRPHNVFVCGNHEDAKATVRGLLADFGWSDEEIVDLGDIGAARGAEMYLPLWLRLMGNVGGATFNIRVVRPE